MPEQENRPLKLKPFVPSCAIDFQYSLEQKVPNYPQTLGCVQGRHYLFLDTLAIEWPIDKSPFLFYLGDIPGYKDRCSQTIFVPREILKEALESVQAEIDSDKFLEGTVICPSNIQPL